MSRYTRLTAKILTGRSDGNIPFTALCQLLLRMGFEQRVRGSHHIFTQAGVEEILNLQPRKDGKAKPYQDRQLRAIPFRYRWEDSHVD